VTIRVGGATSDISGLLDYTAASLQPFLEVATQFMTIDVTNPRLDLPGTN
jgi:hypothetical protein